MFNFIDKTLTMCNVKSDIRHKMSSFGPFVQVQQETPNLFRYMGAFFAFIFVPLFQLILISDYSTELMTTQ